MGFLLRWIAAFALLALTYNPTQWNFVRWAMSGWEDQTPLIALSGLLLLAGFVIYLRATFRSIGAPGMLLVLGIIAALIWVAYDQGWIDLQNPTVNTWIALVALATVLGVGLSWSLVRRRLSGQADVDDVDE